MNAIALSRKQYQDLKQLVYQASGINLHEGKLELLKSKLAKRMRFTGKSFKEYLSFLAANEREVIEFIDTVTTNHSFFFRENNSIAQILRDFDARPDKKKHGFKIWCAACSTGDEPYSVAVQLKALGLNFDILATDISHSVLATATRGVYRDDKVKNVPRPMLHSFFQKGSGKYQGYIRVKKEIKDHVRFQKFNLIHDPLPQHKFDAVLCRNVMIYFDHSTSERVVNRLYETILPKGYFAIGNAESLMNLSHGFKSVPKVPSLYMK